MDKEIKNQERVLSVEEIKQSISKITIKLENGETKELINNVDFEITGFEEI